jgi:phytoene dehydrogenase-like protein
MVGENMALGEDSAGGVQEEIEQTVSSNKEGDNVNASGAQPDLLAIIWRSLQEYRERNEKNRKLDEERWDRNRKLEAEKWETFSDKLTSQFKSEVDKLNGSILQRVEQETDRLSGNIHFTGGNPTRS